MVRTCVVKVGYHRHLFSLWRNEFENSAHHKREPLQLQQLAFAVGEEWQVGQK
jgi:hypothetical protein